MPRPARARRRVQMAALMRASVLAGLLARILVVCLGVGRCRLEEFNGELIGKTVDHPRTAFPPNEASAQESLDLGGRAGTTKAETGGR